MQSVADLAEALAAHARALRPLRADTPLANDMYEAADDWHNLATLLIEHADTADFPARAQQEEALLARLGAVLAAASASEQARYQPVLDAGARLIGIAADQRPNPDGARGFLRVIRARFAFLRDHGFTLVHTTPISARFSSGQAFVTLELSPQASQTCTFGPDATPTDRYGLDDLLFLRGDPAWATFPQTVDLQTPAEIDRWFATAAHMLQHQGADILDGGPAIFVALQEAQIDRDEACVRAMNERYLPAR